MKYKLCLSWICLIFDKEIEKSASYLDELNNSVFDIREQKLHMNILFALCCLAIARASIHNLLWDMEPPSALHQLRLGPKYMFKNICVSNDNSIPMPSIHEHVSQADKKLKKVEPDWASQLADFLTQNKEGFQFDATRLLSNRL